MLHALHCWIILIFFYAYALNFINRCIWSLFWLLGVPIGSQFHKKLGPYFKAWGSLLVSGTVHKMKFVQVVESPGQNGCLFYRSLWGGTPGEAVEGSQPDGCLHRPHHPGRGVRRQDVPRVSRLPFLPPAQSQVSSGLGGSWRPWQIAFGEVCRVSHWSHTPSVKFLAAGDHG